MAELDIRGGAGGSTIAIDDLAEAAGVLHRCADALADAGRSLAAVDVHAMLPGQHSPLVRDAWGRLIDAVAVTTDRLAGAATRATTLAWRSRATSARYAVAEWEAERRVIAARLITRGVIGAARDLGRGLGWLHDGTMDLPRGRDVPHCAAVHVEDIASLMTSQSLLSGHPVVRVIEVPQPDGGSAWIVQIPGTITFSPVAGEIPHDGTADLEAMLDRSTVLARSALHVLAQAQADSGRFGEGDPVLLSGHSLGGLAAMQIASDEELVRVHGITHVSTAGSPVGQFEPREEVRVLSLEHRQDPVTRLDLVANPDRPNWVTVTRDLPDATGLFGTGGDAHPHGAITYRDTARLAAQAAASGSSPSLEEWTASAAPFFATRPRPGRATPAPTVRDADVRRFQDEPGTRRAGPLAPKPATPPITCE